MNNKLNSSKKILKKYCQEHLLAFYDDLNNDEKENLLEEILNLNFKEILDLYKQSKVDKDINCKISPLSHIEKEKLTKEQKEEYKKIGEKHIKLKEYAVVTMAGGQGTRLGYKGPKGTYEIKFSNKEKMSLFEIQCKEIQRTNEKYQIIIPWYIMVSKENKLQTIGYFEKNNYFNYPKESIHFFVQDTIPLIDIDGKIVLQEYHKIKMVSNGNGNVFKAMKDSNIIKQMKKEGIKWIFFGGIDNVLLRSVDSLFLGMIIKHQLQIGSKSIFKEEPLENTAVFCKKDGRPAILDYDEIDLELSEKKNEKGEYLYRESNILSHIMSIDAIDLASKKNLPYHRAFKKNPIINEEGMKIVPTEPNTFKFENFIFDAFQYFDDMLLLRIKKEDEFAPIKDFTGIYTPETARDAYERKYIEYGKKDL